MAMMWRLLVLAAWVTLGSAPLGAQPLTTLEAELDWRWRVELGVPVSGVVRELPVAPGQAVTEGEVLLALDDRAFRARVASAEAQVRSAEARFEEAGRERDRAAELYDRTVLSDHERQLAEIAHAEAAAELQMRRAAATLARLELEYSVIRAPFDGLLAARRVSPGQPVVSALASAPLLTLVGTGELLARGWISRETLQGLQLGQPARVQVRGAWYPAQIAELGVEADTAMPAQGHAVAVRFAAPAALRLLAGEPAMVELSVAP